MRINLSDGTIRHDSYTKYGNYWGGRGANQAFLFNEFSRGTDALSPRSVLAVGAGLLCGTTAPGASRVSIDTKNTLTGGIGSSNVGGDFGAALRTAGIVNLLIVGRSRKPTYLYINDDNIQLRDATPFQYGLVPEVNLALLEEVGNDFQTLIIGPAGEHLVRQACVIVGNARAAGRSGAGAVMGSKNLKAIVVKGSREVRAVQQRKFDELSKAFTDRLRDHPFNKRRSRYGVYCYEDPWGMETPYRNFSGEEFPEKKKAILSPDAFFKFHCDTKRCGSCPIECWASHKIPTENGGGIVEALQGNDPDNFGAKLDIADPIGVLKAHKLCNDLGLDVDVTSNAISWSMDCFERGIIDETDTRGLRLEWGNQELIFELIRQIAYREKFGNTLAEGCKRASDIVGKGSGALCYNIKGNDLFECLWASPPWAFGTVVSPRGGTHTRGAVIRDRIGETPANLCMKLFGVPTVPPAGSYDNVEKLVVFMERLNAVLDSLGLCMFTHSYRLDMLLPEDYAELLSAATGEEVSETSLMTMGERIHTLEKCFNVLHTNWCRDDDYPPIHFTRPQAGNKYCIDLEKWHELLDRYYMQHGWDKESGSPTRTALMNLGMSDICSALPDIPDK